MSGCAPYCTDGPCSDACLARLIAAAEERGAARVRERVLPLVERWEAEAAERGPYDKLYTSGAAAMVRRALGGAS